MYIEPKKETVAFVRPPRERTNTTELGRIEEKKWEDQRQK